MARGGAFVKKTEKGHRSSSSSSIHRTSNDDFNNRYSSETELGELDPLQDPNSFNDEFNEDFVDPLDDDDTVDETTALANGGLKRRGKRMDEKRLSRAFEVHNRAKRPFSNLSRWLIPKRTNYCLVLLFGVLGLVAILVGTGAWVQKKRYSTSGLITSPPYYPAPRGGTMRSWQDSYAKAADMVRRMSLMEKINVTTGTGWMMGPCVGNTGPALEAGFPSLCLQDGPLGIRFTDHITANPAGITVGSTWNKKLMHKRGRLIGQEAKAKGVNVQLGPSVGPLGRMPAGGRNWEGFGSDPVLQGIAAAETIRGIQQEGVMATIKHFVGNEQEHFRMPNEWGLPTAISSNIDDRTLHEVYAWPFADAIRAGVASVMCSYNQVNNSYACQNSKLINGILKDELGFQGFVQSDWLAQRGGVASALAGLDMSMPGDGQDWANGVPFWGSQLTESIMNGTLAVDRLDDMVTRIVAAWYQVGQDNKQKWPGPPNFSSWTDEARGLIHPGSDDKTVGLVNHFVDAAEHGDFSHHGLARRVAAEGIVLLKNEGNILPLDRDGRSQDSEDQSLPGNRRIAIIGEDSIVSNEGPNACPDRNCNNGTLAMGWGSGAVDFPYLVSPLEALKRNFHKTTVELNILPTNEIFEVGGADLQNEDRCIVFVNADGGEGFTRWQDVDGDRNDLRLQKDGDRLIDMVATQCGISARGFGNVIVVIHAVGPVILESFINNPNVAAVLYAHLPGQESGNALADVLFGRVNPSGHLPFTIGKSLKDYGPGGQIMYESENPKPQQDFDEGTLIDYRWFDAKHISPRYEFGYGKSYSEFKLEDLRLKVVLPGGQDRPSPTPGDRPPPEVQPPAYDSKLPWPDEILFPKGWRKLKKYIYPYLEDKRQADPGEPYHYPEIIERPVNHAAGREGGHPALYDVIVNLDVDVSNIGVRDGSAVVQVYIVFPDGIEEGVGADWPSMTSKFLDARIVERDERPAAVPSSAQSHVRISESMAPTAVVVEKRNADDMADAPPAPPDETKPPPPPVKPAPQSPTTTDVDVVKALWAAKSKVLLSAASFRSKIMETPAELPGPAPTQIMVNGNIIAVDNAFTASMPGPTTLCAFCLTSQTALAPLHYETPSPWKHKAGELKSLLTGRKAEPIIFAPRVLRAFEKLHLRGARREMSGGAGELKTVRIGLTRRDFSYWSVTQQNWVIPEGSFGIEVGLSSRDIRVRGRVF